MGGWRMLKVADYELIRRKVLVDGWSRRKVARELGHARKTVDKAVENSAPPGYRRKGDCERPVIDGFRAVIDRWVEEDRKAPRKQRHTAQRIYERLKEEYGFTGSASAVRRYVALLKPGGEVFFPLVFDPGEEAQADWGQGWVKVGGVMLLVWLFCVRLCHSGAQYVCAFERGTMESFQEGHVRAFAFFGGVPLRMAYDNLKSAVIRVGRGRERELNTAFVELRSHYLYESRFCNPGCGNEKGHVENLVKKAQRTYLTPVPEVLSIGELNGHLLACCQADLDKGMSRQNKSRREMFTEEALSMLPLPPKPYPACRIESSTANKQSLLRFDTNDYSVPVKYAGMPCEIRGFVDRLDIYSKGTSIAAHPRSYGRGEYVLDPFHYLPLLDRKGGALDNARPFKRDPFGEVFTRFRREMDLRLEGEGARQYIRVLLLLVKHPLERVRSAVEVCVERRTFSADAVEIAMRDEAPRPRATLDLAGHPELRNGGSGCRPARIYDSLLRQEVSP
jgi:transposase